MTLPYVGAVPLSTTEHGTADPGSNTLLVLHGLFGSGRNWMSIARQLADRHHVVAADLRNHGSSPWAEPMTYAAMAADLAELVIRQIGAPVNAVGHSMGGKAAMILALRYPTLVQRLVVVDVAPVTYPSSFRAYAEAMRAVPLSDATRRSDVDRALVGAVPDRSVRAFLLQNLVLGEGAPRWRVNLPVLEDSMETISGFPDVPAGVSYGGPVLFIAGGRSDYLHPSQQGLVRRLFPRAQVAVIKNAGHWVHAEQPAEFVTVLEQFLR